MSWIILCRTFSLQAFYQSLRQFLAGKLVHPMEWVSTITPTQWSVVPLNNQDQWVFISPLSFRKQVFDKPFCLTACSSISKPSKIKKSIRYQWRTNSGTSNTCIRNITNDVKTACVSGYNMWFGCELDLLKFHLCLLYLFKTVLLSKTRSFIQSMEERNVVSFTFWFGGVVSFYGVITRSAGRCVVSTYRLTSWWTLLFAVERTFQNCLTF